MIKNFDEYKEMMKNLQEERDRLQQKGYEVEKELQKVKFSLLSDARDYVRSELDKRLDKVEDDTYKISDGIGIKIAKLNEWSSGVFISPMFFYRDGKSKLSGKHFSWGQLSKITLDQFIENVIDKVKKMDETRKKAELTRVAKKYNL